MAIFYFDTTAYTKILAIVRRVHDHVYGFLHDLLSSSLVASPEKDTEVDLAKLSLLFLF